MSQRGAFGLGDGLLPVDGMRLIGMHRNVPIYEPEQKSEPRHESPIDLTEVNGVWMKPGEA